MKEEIFAAVMFLVRFIEKSETFPRDQLENFKTNLTSLLTQRFEKHWFPEVPAKGQGYRCIRVNGLSPIDMTLEQAAVQCGLSYRDLRLPTELTVWVDPSEVCYRLGESEGSYCTLATFPSESSSASSSPTPSEKKKLLRSPRYNGIVPTAVPVHQQHMRSPAYLQSPSPNPLRMRQLSFNMTQRPHPGWRCDRHYPTAPPLYHQPYNTHRYMQRNYKNILTV